jgi:hypothetical protein
MRDDDLIARSLLISPLERRRVDVDDERETLLRNPAKHGFCVACAEEAGWLILAVVGDKCRVCVDEGSP